MHYEIVGRIHTGIGIKWMVIQSWGEDAEGLDVSFEIAGQSDDYTQKKAEKTVRNAVGPSGRNLTWVTPGQSKWQFEVNEMYKYFTTEHFTFNMQLPQQRWFRKLSQYIGVVPRLLPRNAKGCHKLIFSIHPVLT